jgi:TRAP-type C4-dicarboxylate transport system permease large subunit
MCEAFGVGIVLPPIGIALYVACAISGAQIEKASKPLLWYLPVLIAGLALATLFPSITTVLPNLLNFKY